MKKKSIRVIKLVLCFLPVFIFIAGCNNNGGNQYIPGDLEGILLYKKWPFPVGVAVPGARTNNTNINPNPAANALNPGSPQHALLKHFNVYVAENEMKPENIMPASAGGSYNWRDSDALVKYALENGKRIRGHTLFWHEQTPAWFFQGSGTQGRATIDQLYTRMEYHVKTVFEKYGGKIDTWDVFNEVVAHSDASGPRLDSNFTRIMDDAGKTGMYRYEFVLRAFQWARQYADANGGENVKLYLTDFGIERPFQRNQGISGTKQGDFLELVKWLIEKDAPIDGVGFQGHFRLYDHPVEQISQGIDLFSALKRKDGKNIMVQVCELDFSVFSGEKGEINDIRISSSRLNERLADLAATYLEFFKMFETKYNEGKLDMVLIWGLSDGHTWLNNHPVPGRTDHPLLFDRRYNPKEALFKLVEGRQDIN
jgi:endo-1,4-beta-xylanase